MNRIELQEEIDALKDDVEEIENHISRLSGAKHFQRGQFEEQIKKQIEFYNNKYKLHLTNENQLQDFINKKIEELEIKLQGK